MSVPTYVGVGTVFSNVGAGTAGWPAGHAADDIGILVVQTSNQVMATPSGWTALTPQGTGTAATLGSTRVSAFWKRATSNAEAAADIADSGDHQIAAVYAIRGCHTAGDPVNVQAGDVQAGADTTMEIPGLTTTAPDCLVVAIMANATDAFGGQVSAIANASLSTLTNRHQAQTNLGTGGGWAFITGDKAVAGAVSTTTGTVATSSAQARISFALKAPDAGTASFGGIYIATGEKLTAGAIGASTATLYASAVQAKLTIALKPPTPIVNTAPSLTLIPDLFVQVDDDLVFPTLATDPESDPLTYSVVPGTTGLPDGLAIDTSGVIRWTPGGQHKGVWNVTVRVTDTGGLFAERSFNITVSGNGSVIVISAFSGALVSIT